jgi:hypothetical protein
MHRSWLSLWLPLALASCQMNARNNEPGPANASATPPAPEQHLLLVVQHDESGFHVRDRKVVDGPVPTTRVASREPWRIDVEGASATPLYTASMPRKGERRGEFAGADGGIDAVHLTPERFAFVVRVPLLKGAERIRIWEERDDAAASSLELGTLPYPAVAP